MPKKAVLCCFQIPSLSACLLVRLRCRTLSLERVSSCGSLRRTAQIELAAAALEDSLTRGVSLVIALLTMLSKSFKGAKAVLEADDVVVGRQRRSDS